MEIARGSFQLSRFYFDENFPEEACDAMYQIWVKKSCQGYADTVIVAEKDGKAVGFITCSLENEEAGSIGLVGVDENSRGMGVGRALINAALQWFANRSVKSIHVVTQGRNIPALHLYQSHGFMIKSVQIWYHKWFSIIEHPNSL
jgi:ribosomal protein S18 acetylase RimI-like enzyme